MKFTIEKDTFTKLLSNVCAVAGKKSSSDPKPTILQNIRIETKDDTLFLVGTDSDTYIKNNCKANIESDGVITVSAELIYDVVKKMENGSEISCEYSKEENNLNIKSGKCKFCLMCMDAKGYPNFEEQEMLTSFKISAKNFINIIDKTRSSISDDLGRYYLNGLFIQTKTEDETLKLCGVSTDGHRLSIVKTNDYLGKDEISGVIIPKKALPEIKNVLLGALNEDITINLSKTKIKIETDNTIIISKLIDAEFPDYNRVIPQNNDKILKADKKLLTNIINRVSIVANDGHKGVKFILSKNNLLLESSSAENGSASEDIVVDFSYDDGIEIGFNSKFILDIFSQIESDSVNIYFKDNSSAILIKGEEEINDTFVLMPVRI